MGDSKNARAARKAFRTGNVATGIATETTAANDEYAKVWRGPDRRITSLKSFIYGAFDPQRKRIRREDDREHAFIDWYPDHLFFVAAAIMCLSVVDALFTVHLADAGALEFNPILAALTDNDVTWFALAKIAAAGVAVTGLVVVSQARLFRKWPMTGVLYGLLVAYLALTMYGYSLIRATGGPFGV